ncbi:hypothetical protein EVAR_80621_1 [Eumeta japonica]|uniref:Uncharacterized protein n=1 Tax=Eumeta variegata TaxID=151549 RepID=A0A4C1ZYT5_EUMVA|nr:hypothetical protein EVAR_80621_1 [Eumeta japonica]
MMYVNGLTGIAQWRMFECYIVRDPRCIRLTRIRPDILHLCNAIDVKNFRFCSSEPYIPQNMVGLTMAIARGKTAALDVVRIETKTKPYGSYDIEIYGSQNLQSLNRTIRIGKKRKTGVMKYRGLVIAAGREVTSRKIAKDVSVKINI